MLHRMESAARVDALLSRCRDGLVRWTAWTQGYEAGKGIYSGRDFDVELASLAGSKTPEAIVRHLLDFLPFLQNLGTARERWQRFRKEAKDRYFRRVLDSERPTPCNDPDPVELAYHLLVERVDD
jgi:hypothetical protein